jgi:hypothetical protein
MSARKGWAGDYMILKLVLLNAYAVVGSSSQAAAAA